MPEVVIRFPEDVADRLDYAHYQEKFAILDAISSVARFAVTTIEEVVEVPRGIASGKTPNGLRYVDDGVLFLGAGNIRERKLDVTSSVRIPVEAHEGPLKSSALHAGDVLVSMAGAVGKCCIFDADEEANINQAVARLRCDSGKVLPEYLLWYLESDLGQLAFEKYRHDVGQPNINLSEIGALAVIVPEVDEQRRILSSVQPRWDSLQGLLLQAEAMASTVTETLAQEMNWQDRPEIELFFKKGARRTSSSFTAPILEDSDRIDFFHHDPSVLAIVRTLGEHVELVPLASICERPIKRGQQPEYTDGTGVAVIKTAEIRDGHIAIERASRVTDEFFRANVSAQVAPGELLFASTGYGSLGRVEVFEAHEPALVDGHVSIIRLSSAYDPTFVATFLKSTFGQAQVERWWSGSSGQIELAPGDLGRLMVPSCKSVPIRRQRAIARKIKAHLAKAHALQRSADEAAATVKTAFEDAIVDRRRGAARTGTLLR